MCYLLRKLLRVTSRYSLSVRGRPTSQTFENSDTSAACKHLLPLNTVFALFLYQTYTFQYVCYIIYPSLLSHSQDICSLGKTNKFCCYFYSILTILRSKTPPLAFCNKLTNLVVRRPRDFSNLLCWLSAIISYC